MHRRLIGTYVPQEPVFRNHFIRAKTPVRFVPRRSIFVGDVIPLIDWSHFFTLGNCATVIRHFLMRDFGKRARAFETAKIAQKM